MHEKIKNILANNAFKLGADGIYSAPIPSSDSEQRAEKDMREKVAAQQHDNYLEVIARHHSVPVMDCEVDRFLEAMPHGSLVLDIGGCWGWHWRRLAETRPDVGVVIVDFIRANLGHARKVLGPLVGTQVVLMHADATALPFPSAGTEVDGFDGIWTVQVFQHIPDFARACREARRVLKAGGRFVNYSLHATPVNRLIYWLFGKSFHLDGVMKNSFHLTRANDGQREVVAEIFGPVTDRYTECLFHPDLKFTLSGRAGSPLGRFDAHLGHWSLLSRLTGRQRSFEAKKS